MKASSKVLVIGANGLLGQNVIRCAPNDVKIIAAARGNQKFTSHVYKYVEFSLESKKSWVELIETCEPDCIINAAAMTNVDLCETEQKQAQFLNCDVVQWMVDTELPVVHISTDYVFDGESGPYIETDSVNPLGVYGKTKLQSEQVCLESVFSHDKNLVLRTMTLWGKGEELRPSFVDFVKSRLEQNQEVTIVTDQIGNPTLAEDLAIAIWKLMEKGAHGLFHVGGKGCVSRYDWAIEVARHYQLNEQLVKPCLTSDLKQKAKRPLNSGFVLDKMQFELEWLPRSLKEQLSA